MNVNDLFSGTPFDGARAAELDPWRTGDCVPGARFFWAGPDRPDPVTGVDGPGNAAPGSPWHIHALTAEVGDIAIITSQTCDVTAQGPGERHPTVQVSPALSLDGFSPNAVHEIKQGNNVSLVYLTAYPQSGDWAVDLSISMPVSKAALLGIPRRSAFADDNEAAQLSARVGQKAHRPALHDDLADILVPSLRQALKARTADEWKWDIEQVRLIVLDGSRLEPKRVQLLVVTEDDKPHKRALDTWRRTQAKSLRKRPAGIVLAPNLWQHVRRADLALYRFAAPLRLPELDRPDFL